MHILVAVDRSPESQNALVNALDIASAMDGRVSAVHVVPAAEEDPAADSQDPPPDAAAAERGGSLLEEVEERARNRGIPIETELIVGDPIEKIASYAESAGVDAIYIGHRGLSSTGTDLPGDKRGPLGSVSKGLVERTTVPVTVYDRGL